VNQARELIREIEKVGGSIQLKDGGRLRIEAPKGTLTDDIRKTLAVHKKEILQALKDTRTANQPYINEDGVLVIRFDSDPKYHWWNGGQSALETLRELKAPPEVLAMYAPGGTA